MLVSASFYLRGLAFFFCQIFYETEMSLVEAGSTCKCKKQLRCVCKENMLTKLFSKVSVWKSSVSYRKHRSSRLPYAFVLLKHNLVGIFFFFLAK